jgi:hypothetical protein
MEFGVKMYMLLGAILGTPIIGILCYYVGKFKGRRAEREDMKKIYGNAKP